MSLFARDKNIEKNTRRVSFNIPNVRIITNNNKLQIDKNACRFDACHLCCCRRKNEEKKINNIRIK